MGRIKTIALIGGELSAALYWVGRLGMEICASGRKIRLWAVFWPRLVI